MSADQTQTTKTQEQAAPQVRKVRHTVGLVKFLERALTNTDWFVLLHDGYRRTDKDQVSDPTFYTRLYRMRLDGEFVNTWIKFVYNLRDNWADFELSWHDTEVRASARELSSRRLVSAIGATTEEGVSQGAKH